MTHRCVAQTLIVYGAETKNAQLAMNQKSRGPRTACKESHAAMRAAGPGSIPSVHPSWKVRASTRNRRCELFCFSPLPAFWPWIRHPRLPERDCDGALGSFGNACDCCICCRQAGLRMFCTPCTTAIEKAACESLSSRSLTSTSTRRPAIAIQCAYLSHPGWACCPWLRTCIFILGSTEVQLKDYVSRRFCWKCRDARVSFCKCEELLDLPNHTEVCAACLSAPVHQLYGYTVTTPELRTGE